MVVGPFIAFAYGAWWLYRNRSRVTQDADYPAAVTKVKGTMVVWVAVLLVQLAAYLILNGLPQPLVNKIIHDGNNRPVLSIAGVKADHLLPFPGRKDSTGREFPLLVVSFKNDGNTSALLTQAAAEISLRS